MFKLRSSFVAATLLALAVASGGCASKSDRPVATSPAESSTSVVSMDIGGMTCEVCQGKVQTALSSAPGVLAAEVDLKQHTATVRCSTSVSDDQLAAAVKAAGADLSGSVTNRTPASEAAAAPASH